MSEDTAVSNQIGQSIDLQISLYNDIQKRPIQMNRYDTIATLRENMLKCNYIQKVHANWLFSTVDDNKPFALASENQVKINSIFSDSKASGNLTLAPLEFYKKGIASSTIPTIDTTERDEDYQKVIDAYNQMKKDGVKFSETKKFENLTIKDLEAINLDQKTNFKMASQNTLNSICQLDKKQLVDLIRRNGGFYALQLNPYEDFVEEPFFEDNMDDDINLLTNMYSAITDTNQTSIIITQQNYASSCYLMSKGINEFQIKGDFPDLFSFGASQASQYENTQTKDVRSRYVYGEYNFPYGTIRFNKIRSTVRQEVLDFFKPGEEITLKRLKKFFDKYGKIVPVIATYGGKLYDIDHVTVQDIKEETHKLAEKSLTAQAALKALLAAIGGGSKKGEEDKLTDRNQEYNQQRTLQCTGGDKRYITNIEKWIESLGITSMNWGIIKVEKAVPTYHYLNSEHKNQIKILLSQQSKCATTISKTSQIQDYNIKQVVRKDQQNAIYTALCQIDNQHMIVGKYFFHNKTSFADIFDYETFNIVASICLDKNKLQAAYKKDRDSLYLAAGNNMYLVDLNSFNVTKKITTEYEVNAFEFYDDKILACQGKGYIYLYNNDLTHPKGEEVYSKCELGGRINQCLVEKNDDQNDDFIIVSNGVQVYKLLTDKNLNKLELKTTGEAYYKGIDLKSICKVGLKTYAVLQDNANLVLFFDRATWQETIRVQIPQSSSPINQQMSKIANYSSEKLPLIVIQDERGFYILNANNKTVYPCFHQQPYTEKVEHQNLFFSRENISNPGEVIINSLHYMNEYTTINEIQLSNTFIQRFL